MSAILSWVRVGAFAAAVVLGGCAQKKETGSEVESFAKETFEPQLLIVDDGGEPLAARISVGMSTAMSDTQGRARLAAQPRDKTTPVTVTADGFAPVTKTLAFDNSYSPLRITLPRYRQIEVDAETGGHVDVESAAVELPGRALLRADGAPYTGAVSVGAVPLFDASKDDAVSGDGFGRSAEGPVPVAFLGGIDLQIRAADGAPLSFAAGERPVVSIVLPVDVSARAGETMPLWDLDRATGLWNEVSTCEVQALAEPRGEQTLACVGSVEHFSAVAVGTALPAATCVNVILKLTKPIPSPYRMSSWSAGPRNFGAYYAYVPQFSPYTGLPLGPSPGAPLGAITLAMASSTRPAQIAVRAWVATVNTVMGGAAAPAIPLDVMVPVTWRTGWDPSRYLTATQRFDPNTCQQLVISADPSQFIGEDADGDGFRTPLDCNDHDRLIYPGAPAILCDGKDHNCDGKPDSQTILPPTLTSTQMDAVWNAYCGQTRAICGTKLSPEVPGNTRDEDCDGFVSDFDGDGYFSSIDPRRGTAAADCNDSNKNVHPGAQEVKGNYLDENCDGVAADQDNDGYPSAKEAVLDPRVAGVGIDCNDLDAQVHPGAGVRDLAVLAPYYQGGTRIAAFCDLFDAKGQPTSKLRSLFLQADRNCNGVAEDVDGDGVYVASAGVSRPPPYDGNDYDPRVQAKGQIGSPNAKQCPFDVMNAGGGDRQACPRLFGTEQYCVQALRNGVPAESLCVARDWSSYSIAPEPYGFGQQYGPCAPGVIKECAAGTLCAGPIRFAPWYKDALRRGTPPYDVDKASFTGFCMPVCNLVP
jgi:hypothetical protein